jgi:hypothetical protein
MRALFKNERNLERFIDKYREEIRYEIDNIKHKKVSKEKYNNNFYVNYSQRDNKKERNNDPILTVDIDRHEREFNRINRKMDRKYSEYDDDETTYYVSTQKSEKSPAGNEMVLKWRKFGEFLKRKIVRVGINGAFGVNKAFEILQSFEEDHAHKIPLDEKIKVLGVLNRILEERNIYNMLGGEKVGKNFMRQKLVQRLLRKEDNHDAHHTHQHAGENKQPHKTKKLEEGKQSHQHPQVGKEEPKKTEENKITKKYDDIKQVNKDLKKLEEAIKKGDKRKPREGMV